VPEGSVRTSPACLVAPASPCCGRVQGAKLSAMTIRGIRESVAGVVRAGLASAECWRQDSFEMFLFFQPSGGVPVPVKAVQWCWYGLAQTNGSGGWQLISGSGTVLAQNVPVLWPPAWTNTPLPGAVITNHVWIDPFP
jgi:hypothetical protein